MGLPGRGKAKQAGSGASMNTAHTRGKSQNRAPSANSTLGPALEHDIRAAIVGPAALSWALPTREDQLTSGLASERHESDHGAGARVGSSAWIALSRQSFGGLPGCGKLRVRRFRRGGLARRRGFRSGFSRLPADPTEPDDGQSWPPRRSDQYSRPCWLRFKKDGADGTDRQLRARSQGGRLSRHLVARGLDLVRDRLQVVVLTPLADPPVRVDLERGHDRAGDGLRDQLGGTSTASQ